MRVSDGPALAPVAAKARIEVLDILRGIAILGIFYINVPYMAASIWRFTTDIRSIGWTSLDQDAWAAVNILFAGTQRCLLQFLFGAGMMLLARKAMTPDGPVAVADLYYRRNFWLLAFGMADVFLLLWPGDILHIYAIAALFLFPFRTLAPRVLLALGLGWAVLFAVGIPDYGAREYVTRADLLYHVEHIEKGQAMSPADREAALEWQRVSTHPPQADLADRIAREREAHAGPWFPYAKEAWRYWQYLTSAWLFWNVIEAFCTMLIGVALWKWGVIQGQKSRRFYGWLMLGAYGFGITARTIGVGEVMSFAPGPRTIWITGEFARLAVGLGHLALVNWLVQVRWGEALLNPLKACGRMAFSLYFFQQFVGKYILFAPFALNLWGRFGWAEMFAISTIGIAVQIGVANVWLRYFTSGPLEWLWRSLSYVKLQPLVRRPASAPAHSIFPLPAREG